MEKFDMQIFSPFSQQIFAPSKTFKPTTNLFVAKEIYETSLHLFTMWTYRLDSKFKYRQMDSNSHQYSDWSDSRGLAHVKSQMCRILASLWSVFAPASSSMTCIYRYLACLYSRSLNRAETSRLTPHIPPGMEERDKTELYLNQMGQIWDFFF